MEKKKSRFRISLNVCLWTLLIVDNAYGQTHSYALSPASTKVIFWQGYDCHCHRPKVLCNSSCTWAPSGSIWQWMALQKYLIELAFTRRATDIAAFLLAQAARVCNFFLLYWDAQMWLSNSCFLTLLIKILTFLTPVSPTAKRQIITKPEFTIERSHCNFFLHRSNCQILIRYSLYSFGGMNLHPQPQRTVTEGNDSICQPAMPPHFC